ncbi:hypothetical protein AAGQ96_02680 [Pantoea sp. MBD-2R]|uniref:hypothetical protein n=1 Tax=Pantoea sp. MBD-2R TaxID=3141540 RepID=UPI003182F007
MKDYERTKWSRITTSLSLDELSRHFKDNKVGDDRKGYSDIEIGRDFCSGIYNERISNNLISLDYHGNEFEQELIEFYSVSFSFFYLTNKYYILSLTNPPKTLKPFIDFLFEGLNYKIGISGFELNAGLFLDELLSSKEVSLLKVKKVKVNSVVISDAAKATVEVTSKNNAIDDISLLLENKDYLIDKLKISCMVNNVTSEIEISKGGSFCATSEAIVLTKNLLFKQVADSI